MNTTHNNTHPASDCQNPDYFDLAPCTCPACAAHDRSHERPETDPVYRDGRQQCQMCGITYTAVTA